MEIVAIDGVVLLALTLGGGIAAIDALSERLFGEGYLRELATVFGATAREHARRRCPSTCGAPSWSSSATASTA